MPGRDAKKRPIVVHVDFVLNGSGHHVLRCGRNGNIRHISCWSTRHVFEKTKHKLSSPYAATLSCSQFLYALIIHGITFNSLAIAHSSLPYRISAVT